MMKSDDGDRSTRVITVLRLIASADQPLTANEISVRAGLPKATVYRLCDHLVESSLIRRQVAGRGFVAGSGLIDFAEDVLAGKSAYIARHSVLQRVARITGETCNLVVPDGNGMIYWDRVETQWPLRLQLPVGTVVPFHATASGKMYLATLPASRRSRLIRELDLAAHTAHTLTAPDSLMQHLDETAKRGFSLDCEEFIEGMTAVAVPVFARGGRCLGALALHAPRTRMSIEQARMHVPLLMDAAQRLAEGIPEGQDATASEGASKTRQLSEHSAT